MHPETHLVMQGYFTTGVRTIEPGYLTSTDYVAVIDTGWVSMEPKKSTSRMSTSDFFKRLSSQSSAMGENDLFMMKGMISMDNVHRTTSAHFDAQ